MIAVFACSQGNSPVIYVTATTVPAFPSGEPTLPNPFKPTFTPNGPTATAIQPTPSPTYPPTALTTSYTVQAGDSLATIADEYGTTVQQIVALNSGVTAETPIFVGQVLTLPGRPSRTTPNIKIIPDSELSDSPAAIKFDIFAYIKFQPGFIRVYSEDVQGHTMSGAEIVQFVSTSASINPRLLLALLEYRGGWISNPVPSSDSIIFPMGLKQPNQQGLFKQLNWTANQLNAGYYGFKYQGMTSLKFTDNSRLAFAPELNPGSVAVQFFLSQTDDRSVWMDEVKQSGFFATYMAMFGDPFGQDIEPLIRSNIKQPTFQLPFKQGQTWYFTAGPHGGWDNNSGWSAIDFAPPAPPDAEIAAQGKGFCYVSPEFATAIVGGLVGRSGDGAVGTDVDMDRDERTGRTVVYLHIADQDSIKAGTIVQPGTPIGHPSCEGFYLNAVATHLHVARRYNGEWIPADCWACAPSVPAPPFVIGGWTVRGYPNQVYQGWLEKEGQIRRAEQGRDNPDNQVSW